MKLTPLDIHHKEFRLALRGYNQEQVDQFLDEVADELERLFKENISLSEKLEVANERVRSYSEIEKTLHNTMLAAQTSAEDIKAKAAKEADVLLRDAELKAKELVQTALSEKQKTQAEFMTIKAAEDEFRMKFRGVLEDYMRKIHEIPVAADAAGLVGLTMSPTFAPEGAEPAYAPPSAAGETPGDPPPSDAAPATDPGTAAEPVPPMSFEAVSADAGDPARPHARLVRSPGEDTGPLAADPPQTGFVNSLTLGEVEGPDLRPDVPTFVDPVEFPVGRFGSVGERDSDTDIEQID